MPNASNALDLHIPMICVHMHVRQDGYLFFAIKGFNLGFRPRDFARLVFPEAALRSLGSDRGLNTQTRLEGNSLEQRTVHLLVYASYVGSSPSP